MRERVKLVLYLTASYPSVQKFKEIIEKTRSIVDMFEIGVPTVNPKYDGPTIRMTYREAEIKGLEAIKTLPAITSDFTVMSYLEDHLHHFEDFVNLVKSLSAKSILLPDLLFDYYDYIDLYVKLKKKYGVEPSFFISSKFPYRVVRKLLTYSPLFIYLGLQASSGIKLPLLV
ncbi:MAG: tryptophan synthase subunit alpha, partial [Thermoprotei archaeon ex4572_64]